MALAISSIPVLTGEAGAKFEKQAQQAYDSYIHRTEKQKKEINARYNHGMEMVQKMLDKSKIKR